MKRIEIEGQLSLFDLDINIPKAVTKNLDNPIFNLKEREVVIKEDALISNAEIVSKYQNICNLNRIIKYCGGGFGVETTENNKHKTLYINRFGKEEFVIENKCPVLPMDQILLTNIAINYNEEQAKLLSKTKDKVERVIKRKGDENIILKKKGQAIAINSKGWLLEFGSEPIYEKDEILFENYEKDKAVIEELRVGEKCLVDYDGQTYKGTVRSKHSIYPAYSIDFEKQGKMCNTTFHISQIREVS